MVCKVCLVTAYALPRQAKILFKQNFLVFAFRQTEWNGFKPGNRYFQLDQYKLHFKKLTQSFHLSHWMLLG